MKKLFFIISIVFLAFVVNAQNAVTSSSSSDSDDSRNKLQIGIKAGANYSGIYDSKGEQFKAEGKFGFVGGGFLSIPIGEFLGFQPEVLFSQRGFKASGVLLGNNYSVATTNSYIDIPLQLQLKPSDVVTFLVGVQYSYLVSQKNTFTFGKNSVDQEKEFKNDNIRKNLFGLVGGIDFNIQKYLVLSGRVGADMLYNRGDGTSTTPRYKNIWGQITLGFKFY